MVIMGAPWFGIDPEIFSPVGGWTESIAWIKTSKAF